MAERHASADNSYAGRRLRSKGLRRFRPWQMVVKEKENKGDKQRPPDLETLHDAYACSAFFRSASFTLVQCNTPSTASHIIFSDLSVTQGDLILTLWSLSKARLNAQEFTPPRVKAP